MVRCRGTVWVNNWANNVGFGALVAFQQNPNASPTLRALVEAIGKR